MNNFVEQVRKLNEKYGKILSLEELKECKKNGEFNLNEPENGSIDELAFVHITNYEPTDNRIKTSKETGAKYEYEGVTIDKSRNTTHYTVNGTVTSHESGDWDKRKYGIIIPGENFLKENGKKCLSGGVADIFHDEGGDLNGGIIICPKSDYERLSRENPKNLVIYFEGDLAVDSEKDIDYPKEILLLMGIEQYKMGDKSYKDSILHDTKNNKILDSGEVMKHYIDIIKKNNDKINGVKHYWGGLHSESLQAAEEDVLNYTQLFYGRLNQLSNDELMRFINILDLTSDEKESENNKQFMDSVSKYDFGIQGNLEKAINIINKNKAYDVERKKVSINMLDEGLSKLGLSCLQGFDNLDKIEQRAAESIIIDNYLEVSVKDIYDGDMITTNAKRIKMIKEKMQEEGKENNPVAKKAFENCVKHFIRDYKTLSQCYDKRVDMEGFDFDKYTEKLQDTFMELGIDNKDIELMDETDIFKQINEEQEIQKLLKEQGYVEKYDGDMITRNAKRIKMIKEKMQE